MNEAYLQVKSIIYPRLTHPSLTNGVLTQGEISQICWELYKEFSSSKLEYIKLKDQKQFHKIEFFKVKGFIFEEAIRLCEKYDMTLEDVSQLFRELHCDFSTNYEIMS